MGTGTALKYLDRINAYLNAIKVLLPKLDHGTVIWGAFAERCINNRTIRHETKGANRVLFYKDANLGK